MKTSHSILIFIDSFISNNGFSPTVREIGKGTYLSSTSSVWRHLDRLKQRKMISFVRQSPRTITITEKGKELLEKLNSS
nr:MAG TPA: LexA repressor [Caudoviricetes sp.]